MLDVNVGNALEIRVNNKVLNTSLTVRMNEQDHAALSDQAASKGRTISNWLRKLIKDGLTDDDVQKDKPTVDPMRPSVGRRSADSGLAGRPNPRWESDRPDRRGSPRRLCKGRVTAG